MKKYETIESKKENMLETAVNWISLDEIRIIEVGCGNGNFAEFINQRGISKYIGVDINKDEIDKAHEKHDILFEYTIKFEGLKPVQVTNTKKIAK